MEPRNLIKRSRFLLTLGIVIILAKSVSCEVDTSAECIPAPEIDSEEISSSTVAEGSNVTIECSIFVGPIGPRLASDLDRSNIIWKWKRKLSENWIILKQSDTIMIKNQSTVTDGTVVLSELKVQNIVLQNAGIYGCFENSTSLMVLDKSHVFVGYSPVTPDNIECVTSGDMEMLECCWQVNRTYCPTQYIMNYNIEGTSINNYSCCKFDPTSEQSCCKTSTQNLPYVRFILQLNVTNQLGSETSNVSYINPALHVKPYAPTDVKSVAGINENTNYINVTWTPPDGTPQELTCLEYMVQYREDKDNSEWISMEKEGLPRAKISDLRSTRTYKVRVQAKPLTATTYTCLVKEGYWSDWSDVSNATTLLTIPFSDLKFQSSQTVVPSSSFSDFATEVSWIPYDAQNEPGFYNSIKYGDCQNEEDQNNVTNGNTDTVFISGLMGKGCIFGAYCNQVGCSDYSSITVSYDNAPQPAYNVSAIVTEKSMNINWKIPENSKSLNCQIRVCSSERNLTEDHGLTTSNLQHDYCTSASFSKILLHPVDCSDLSADIEQFWSPCYEYYAIVEVVSTAYIVQSIESNIVTYDPNIISPTTFLAEDSSTATNFKISVEWSHMTDCYGMSIGIKYRAVSGFGCPDSDCSTMVPYLELFSECSTISGYLTSNIYGDVTYAISMELVCTANTNSDMFNILAAASSNTMGFVVPNTVENVKTAVGKPGPPTDISLAPLNTVKTMLSWDPPIHSNGPLNGYRVMWKTSSGSSKSADTTTTSYDVLIGCPTTDNSTTYTFQVQAYNILENGSAILSDGLALTGISCVVQSETVHISPAVVIIICSILLTTLVVCVILYIYRKRISKFIKRNFPDVPKPKVSEDVLSKSNLGKDTGITDHDYDEIEEQIDDIFDDTIPPYIKCKIATGKDDTSLDSKSENSFNKKHRLDSGLGVDNEAFEKDEETSQNKIENSDSGMSVFVIENTHHTPQFVMSPYFTEAEILTLSSQLAKSKLRAFSTLSLDSGLPNRSRTTSESTYQSQRTYLKFSRNLSGFSEGDSSSNQSMSSLESSATYWKGKIPDKSIIAYKSLSDKYKNNFQYLDLATVSHKKPHETKIVTNFMQSESMNGYLSNNSTPMKSVTAGYVPDFEISSQHTALKERKNTLKGIENNAYVTENKSFSYDGGLGKNNVEDFCDLSSQGNEEEEISEENLMNNLKSFLNICNSQENNVPKLAENVLVTEDIKSDYIDSCKVKVEQNSDTDFGHFSPDVELKDTHNNDSTEKSEIQFSPYIMEQDLKLQTKESNTSYV